MTAATVFDCMIAGHRFVIVRHTFDAVGNRAGFRRLQHRTRHDYSVDGERVTKQDWFMLRDAYRAEVQ